jgi:choline kinase
MRLIILAAGYGSRLSPATQSIPKPLFDLGEGVTILDRQLEAAKLCGIEDVRLVVGYRAEQIEEKLAERTDLGLNTDVYYNPFYKTTNNLVSLWTARPAMDDDFIMLNGDDVFRPSLLRQLMETEGQFTATISRKSQYDEDDTKLITEGARIVSIGKDLPPEKVNAEWIGMCIVRGDARSRFVTLMDQLIRDPSLRDGAPHYLSLLQGLIDSGVTMNFHEIAPDSWAEIDFQMDLDYVRTNLTRFNDV